MNIQLNFFYFGLWATSDWEVLTLVEVEKYNKEVFKI